VLADIDYSDASDDDELHVWGDWYIAQCRGCKEIVACKKWYFSEEIGLNPDTQEYGYVPTYEVFPLSVPGVKISDDYSRCLPSNIYAIYREVYASMAIQNRILPGIGIRAIVEAVCMERKAVGGNLRKKIDSLCTLGLITKEGADILHNLRFMGNKSAHEIAPHTHLELASALRVADHLVSNVYVLPDIAKQLPKIPRAGKKKKKKTQ